ncbi:MAG TPA: hypothetical protein DEP53_10675 [Bacteroidetes bacterium]|nr:hypothetical protein [Bacteroidota bacterium]
MCLVRSIATVLIVLYLGFPGCADQGEATVDSLVPGSEPSAYAYRAYTSAGVLAVVGTLTMARSDSTTIAGTWASEGVSSTDSVGPQLGAGTLAGELTGARLSLNLNPGWADNNVILIGSIEGEKIVGTWTWVTFAGPRTHGTFEAVKKK